MKRSVLILMLCCFFVKYELQAQSVSENMALRVATNFFQLNPANATINIRPLGGGHSPAMYVCEYSNKWVLIAGDMRVESILAYSDEEGVAFPSEDNMPPAMRYILESYSNLITTVQKGDCKNDCHADWNMSEDNCGFRVQNRDVVVSPLLIRDGHEVIWGQTGNNDYPSDTARIYNKFCPPRNNCNHAAAGCVAVAIGQIMWYWQWPYAQTTQYNINRIVNTYDWDNMPYQLTNASSLEEADMIATLLHDIGVSVSMDYGCSSSSAFIQDAPSALRNKFYYNADEPIERSNFDDSTWFNMLKGNLNNQRPVLYAGYSSAWGSHAFVVDGYSSNNYYHVNLGWTGAGNGNYNLNSLSSSNQYMVANIYPNYNFYCTPFNVPYTDCWPTNFTVQHGGGITLWQISITNGMRGHIYSEEFIKITEGVYINLGAEVYIGIKGSRCCEEQINPALNYMIASSSANKSRESANTISNAQKVFKDGHVYIIRGENTYNASGIRIK